MLILLADQPLITRQHLNALVATWRESEDSIVATGFAGIVGPPVIFPSRFHSELLTLTGDQGARTILSANEADVLNVPFADAAIDFIQREPLQGEPATEKTEIRILYDDAAIYFGVSAYESWEPSP